MSCYKCQQFQVFLTTGKYLKTRLPNKGTDGNKSALISFVHTYRSPNQTLVHKLKCKVCVSQNTFIPKFLLHSSLLQRIFFWAPFYCWLYFILECTGGKGRKERKKNANYLEESSTMIQFLIGIKRYQYSVSRCTVNEVKELASYYKSLAKVIQKWGCPSNFAWKHTFDTIVENLQAIIKTCWTPVLQ